MRAVFLLVYVAFASARCPFASQQASASPADEAREARITPRPAFKAQGAKAIREKLNTQLAGNSDLSYASHKPCEAFSIDELNTLQHDLLCRMDPGLIALSGGSDPVASHRSPLHKTPKELSAHHMHG
jgi:hypothetical protein